MRGRNQILSYLVWINSSMYYFPVDILILVIIIKRIIRLNALQEASVYIIIFVLGLAKYKYSSVIIIFC